MAISADSGHSTASYRLSLIHIFIDSINSVDRPVIVAYLILTTVLFVFINFVVDLLYTVIDPRIKIR